MVNNKFLIVWSISEILISSFDLWLKSLFDHDDELSTEIGCSGGC